MGKVKVVENLNVVEIKMEPILMKMMIVMKMMKNYISKKNKINSMKKNEQFFIKKISMVSFLSYLFKKKYEYFN